ncbi:MULTISPECIES: TonB-dependent receptor [Pseudomonadota]|jgi:iron complex outermembrane receptor protein|uniref:TonB-dependent receptor n=1 Tax=Pseudomonadota TaxID=1224 RepID=UPI000769DC61|nr:MULTISPECIES: TonB-dependent receptor [Pseudomonadota]MAF61273.1 TonB-dependent receptor [Blastomonas sp.]|tara:strand:- start:19038 stop:21404 length:2367 start_codon:yes stop_codon:yes gene_type:complete
MSVFGFTRFAATRTALTLGVAAAALTALAPVAIAQEAQEQEATTADDGSVIVVTARRRAENLQDVPIAISAFSAERLENQGALDITDISQITPNTTLENSRGTNSTLTAFIRGVGQQDPVPGFEAGVGIYLDDVYLNRPQAAVLDIYEVERIEVLRGPQGTLYGRNTIGGAVKYVTKMLPEDFSLKVRGTYGTYDQAEGVVTVSAPLGDIVRVGGTLARLSRGGFGDNINIRGLENYNRDVWAGRGTLEIGGYGAPVLIRISGDYTRDKSDPRNGHRLIPGIRSGTPVLNDVYDTRAGLNNPRQDIEAFGLAMNISAELTDNLTLRSISAWRKDDSFTPIDFDALPAIDVDVPAVYRNEQVSQEFQLLYEGERLKGLVGFYYLDAKASTAFDVLLFTTLANLNAFTAGDVRTDTWSVFGDFTYDFTDQLSLSLGGRYTVDKRNSTILRQTKLGRSAEFGGTPVVLATTSNFNGEARFTDFNPRASLSFKPNEDHLFFAGYSQGFKGGGFDPRGLSTAAPDTNRDGVRSQQEIFDFLSFEPETVDSYELGWKGSFADNAINLALTGFYADYTNVQVPGSAGFDSNGDGVNDTFIGVTTNAGKAEFKGIEFEGNAVFAREFAGSGSFLSFNATLGYIDGEYKRFIDARNIDVANLRRIQNTPKWTMSGTFSGVFPAFSGNITASTTVSYRSKTFQFETPSPFLDQPGFALWDASLIWRDDEDRFSFGINAKNILDKQYITSGYQFLATAPDGTPTRNAAGNLIPTLGTEGVATAFYGNPRQVFVTGTVKF